MELINYSWHYKVLGGRERFPQAAESVTGVSVIFAVAETL